MESVSEKNNFIYLVFSLVGLLLIGSLIDQFPGWFSKQLFQAVTVVTLAVSVVGIRTTGLRIKTGIGFTLLVLIIVVMGAVLDASGLSLLHLLVMILFYCWATWLAAKQVLFSKGVDGNKIVGAICIYLLIGMIWALFYLALAQLMPNAFNGFEQRIWYDNFASATYFSYVTLTTLGYGDVTPVTPVARFLVYMEAITGAFYMAILVASLVGVHISTNNPDQQ